MRTEFQRLIDDLEELKSTKLYENSFKAIDDCIHLLYSRKNYFESLEQTSKETNLVNLSNLQLCPVCKGNGIVDNGFYNQTSGNWISSGTCTVQCRSCYGKGYIKY